MTDDFKIQLEHLAERMRKIEAGFTPGLGDQLAELRNEVGRLREKSAVDFERFTNISKCIERLEKESKENFIDMKESMKAMKAGQTKAFWLIAAAIIAGVMEFILGGGLNMPGG